MRTTKAAAAQVAEQRPEPQPQAAAAYLTFPPQLVLPPPPAVQQQQAQGGSRPKDNQNKDKNQGQQWSRRVNQEGRNNRARDSRDDKRKESRNGYGKKSNFVTPWPENKSYCPKTGINSRKLSTTTSRGTASGVATCHTEDWNAGYTQTRQLSSPYAPTVTKACMKPASPNGRIWSNRHLTG
jgi:hypothetical protein